MDVLVTTGRCNKTGGVISVVNGFMTDHHFVCLLQIMSAYERFINMTLGAPGASPPQYSEEPQAQFCGFRSNRLVLLVLWKACKS